MDANDYALKVTPASKRLELLIRKAIWLGKGKDERRMLNDERGPEASAEQPGETESSREIADLAKPQSRGPLWGNLPHSDLCVPSSEEPVPAPLPPPLAAESPEPTASPEPPMPPPDLPVEMKGEDLWLRLGDRRWRLRGLAKNLSYEVLRAQVGEFSPSDPG